MTLEQRITETRQRVHDHLAAGRRNAARAYITLLSDLYDELDS